ncbi:helix-turn-helix domain-containing protein [Chitinophaga eiseniae]|uniref:Helix-turn-helix transcriptional regulator n=1 Tax=Chitinophaga eiseniae TaxID=634771 RepID=A0A847SQA0_9BACT|nr:AraC family transcriptional regulator [Chitinophaga eiseniae]NLR78242.1 helix-turn-helix transcriptional regulator [Chitinophaga eiseniae]
MKYLYESFTFPPDQSFTAKKDILGKREYNTLQSHVDFEIILLENYKGRMLIGDHIADINGAELVLLGSYLPHCWQYHRVRDCTQLPIAYIVHFSPYFIGREFLEMPEAKELNLLFDRALGGILFSGDTINRVRKILQQLLEASGLLKIIRMIELLDVLAHSKENIVLASPLSKIREASAHDQQLTRIFDYIYRNFRNDITLEETAAVIHMTPSGFCRYLRKKTDKTFVEILKEIRICHAAKLLLAGKHNIAGACYESGYHNLSNFYKHFKEVKGLPPSKFLKQYRAFQEISQSNSISSC